METLHLASLADWHEWLVNNHAQVSEVWLVYEKGQASLQYEESVEEALCFGWVDSLIKNIDERHHARKFTPRRTGSKWSALNISRAERMIAQGRMTEIGLRFFEEGKCNLHSGTTSRKEQMENWRLELLTRLDSLAASQFTNLPPSLQRQYAGWVMSAKTEETRQKRQAELSATLAKGERLGFK